MGRGEKTFSKKAREPNPVVSREVVQQPDLSCIRREPDGISLTVKLQPRASLNAIGRTISGELRVKVTAPPVDSAANEALLRLLADGLSLPRNCMRLVRGHTSRQKVVKLYGVSYEVAAAKLQRFHGETEV